eukprot:2042907-Rhodomonas_salina.1
MIHPWVLTLVRTVREDKTYNGLKHKYIWPHLRPHIELYVRSCDSCQKMKSSQLLKLGTPQLPDVPTEPWEKISVDFCGPLPTTK